MNVTPTIFVNRNKTALNKFLNILLVLKPVQSKLLHYLQKRIIIIPCILSDYKQLTRKKHSQNQIIHSSSSVIYCLCSLPPQCKRSSSKLDFSVHVWCFYDLDVFFFEWRKKILLYSKVIFVFPLMCCFAIISTSIVFSIIQVQYSFPKSCVFKCINFSWMEFPSPANSKTRIYQIELISETIHGLF